MAEVLAVPALPLTASSGYLFGLIPGFLTVLVSATIAASISFLIGRTLLRDWAQKIASGNLLNTFHIYQKFEANNVPFFTNLQKIVL